MHPPVEAVDEVTITVVVPEEPKSPSPATDNVFAGVVDPTPRDPTLVATKRPLANVEVATVEVAATTGSATPVYTVDVAAFLQLATP